MAVGWRIGERFSRGDCSGERLFGGGSASSQSESVKGTLFNNGFAGWGALTAEASGNSLHIV